MIVAAAAAGVIVSGVKLMKKHTKYLAEKAAATFGPDDEAWTEPANAKRRRSRRTRAKKRQDPQKINCGFCRK